MESKKAEIDCQVTFRGKRDARLKLPEIRAIGYLASLFEKLGSMPKLIHFSPTDSKTFMLVVVDNSAASPPMNAREFVPDVTPGLGPTPAMSTTIKPLPF
jgi:hypothetical protein